MKVFYSYAVNGDRCGVLYNFETEVLTVRMVDNCDDYGALTELLRCDMSGEGLRCYAKIKHIDSIEKMLLKIINNPFKRYDQVTKESEIRSYVIEDNYANVISGESMRLQDDFVVALLENLCEQLVKVRMDKPIDEKGPKFDAFACEFCL